MSSKSTTTDAVRPQVNRRTFVGTLGLVAGTVALSPLASAVQTIASPAAAPSARAQAWSLDELACSYPLYAEPIPYSRRHAAEPALRAATGDPFEQLFLA